MTERKMHTGKLSRRAVLQGAAVTVTAVPILLAGVQSAQAAKATQKAAGYQDTPKNGQSCATCRSFVAPSECKTVEGTISPNGWCRIYIKKA